MGTEKSKGHGIFSPCRHVNNPGQFEAPSASRCASSSMAGGIRDGHKLVLDPGGSPPRSSPGRRAGHALDYESVGAAGRCWVRVPCRCSTRPSRSSASSPAGPSSTSTSPAASARPVAKGRPPTGWQQIMLRLEREGRPATSTCSTRSHTTLRAVASPSSATPQQPDYGGHQRFRDEFEAGLTTPARELFPYEASANYMRARRWPMSDAHPT